MIDPNRMIWVTFEKEGMHRYIAAGEDTNLAEVSFLQYPHRHLFKFKVYIEVTHNDRDIEFIIFKRWLQSLYSEAILSVDYKSVEMIAEDLYEKINAKYSSRDVWIEVSEDGENGCLLKWESCTLRTLATAPVDHLDITDSIMDSVV